MPTPGERVRAAREKLGLTQADLGGELLSASYISHLEHDRRRASPEVAQHLAERLQISPAELQSAVPQISQEEYAATVAMHVRAIETVLDGDLGSVSQSAVRDGSCPGDDDWVTMYLAAEALRHTGNYERLAVAADALVKHPLTEVSASLRTAAMALHAVAMRTMGDLTGSLEVARAAVAAAEESGEPSSRARAALALIPALSELGLKAELREQADGLTSLLGIVTSTPLRGRMAWAAGNTHFILGDADAGLALHELASQWLRPDSDLRLWARFCKASARMRIGAGITRGVETLLRDAGRGLELVGNDSDLGELEIVRSEYLLLTGDPASAMTQAHRALADVSLVPQTRAAAHEVVARAAKQLGDHALSREQWATAADLYNEQGAVDKAISIWRTLAQQT